MAALENITCPYSDAANIVFPSKEYLKRFTDPTADPMKIHIKFLNAWHEFYQEHRSEFSDSSSLLEFGGGPTLYSLISASKYVNSITFADYAESNRNEIIDWKNNSSGSHDWSHYFDYVISQLEGDKTEGLYKQRQDVMREKIKEIIPCNIRLDDVLDSGSKLGPFDIVHTNLCLEIACESQEEFQKCVKKLEGFIKPGGYFLALTAKGGSWYTCAGGGDKLHQLKMDEESILKTFEETGLTVVKSFNIQPLENKISATKSFHFTIAQKK